MHLYSSSNSSSMTSRPIRHAHTNPPARRQSSPRGNTKLFVHLSLRSCMKIRNGTTVGLFLLLGFLAHAVAAQQTSPANSPAYDSAREVTLVGTVTSYQSSVAKPPLGAHLTLNTSAGPVDVHLGDARFLNANHFQIQTGDSVRIIGENVAYSGGTQFLTRVIQKGTQALVLRSMRGTPLSYAARRKNAPSTSTPQG